jgi:anti-sigma-K factor RskA
MSALPPDLHTLTGSYVLDALDADERALFDAHLAVCEACQEEVAELQRAASLLADTVATPVSDQLRTDVMAAIATTRQRAPVTALSTRSRATRLVKLSAVAAGLLLVAATGTLSVVVADLINQVDDLEQAAVAAEQHSALLARLLSASDMMLVQSPADTAPSVRVVMSARHGEGMLMADAMPDAPKDHTYALWMVHHDGTITPAGLITPTDTGRVMHPFGGQFVTAAMLHVTIEPADVTLPQPTGTPVMQVALTNGV